MNTRDQKMLHDIRERGKALAEDLKAALGQGYQITMNMNAQTGTLDVFDVKQMVIVDIDAGLQ